MEHITKTCAKYLCNDLVNKFNLTLKPTHAHEIVAAFFGYKSHASLLKDEIAPIDNLSQAEVVVMYSENFINQRRLELSGLPIGLPDTYTLGEAIYTPLFSTKWWKSLYPPFRSFEKLAKHFVEKDDSFQHAFKFYENLPMHHILDVKTEENHVILTIKHCHEIAAEQLIVDVITTIKLQRVAGYIGYSKPQISVVKLTGHARQILKMGNNQ